MAAYLEGNFRRWGWPGNRYKPVVRQLRPTYDNLNSLARQIYRLSDNNEQSLYTFNQKTYIYDMLVKVLGYDYNIIEERDNLIHVGSSVTGLDTDSSDSDFCLVTPAGDIEQDNYVLKKLRTIARILEQEGLIVGSKVVKTKTVGLLRFTTNQGYDVDFTFGTTSSIKSTHLLKCYSRYDERVRPLVVAVKKWAKKYQIDDAYQGGLSSYSLTLMVIHYLQHCCQPAVLPSLQEKYSHAFDLSNDFRSLSLYEPTYPHSVPANNQTVDRLLTGFFWYFTRVFDYDTSVMSVRTGGILAKDHYLNNRADKSKPHFIYIEEPFDSTNTAQSVFSLEYFERILEAMEEAYGKLYSKKYLPLICWF